MTTSVPRVDPAPPAAEEDAAPVASASPERPAIPASAFAEPGVLPPSRSQSDGDDFDALVFSAGDESEPADEDAPASTLFRQAPDPSRPEAVTQPLAVVPANGAAQKAAAAGVVPERTLTRRELRAMLQAQEANQQANHSPQLAEPIVPVTFTPDAGDSAPAASGTPTVAERPADDEKTAWPFAPLTPSSEPAEPAASATSATSATPAPAFAPTSAAPVVETSGTSPLSSLGLTPPASAAGKAAPSAPDSEDTSAQERRPFTPPTGHWSTAAEVEDAGEPIISRNVGQSTAATTTNALILPAIPRPDATAPLTSTGEILVTGSIDLPRAVGSTGLNPEHLDSSDIDHLLDGEENEFNTSEVAPVRASRAISTHTSTRGVITPPKKRGNALPTVLIITAGVLAVGVIGLLVAAYVLKVF